jgi:invasion protein IalB
MMKGGRVAALTLVGSLAILSGPAAAEEPQSTTATYGDWLVQCRLVVGPEADAAKKSDGADPAAPAKTERICEMVQTFTFRQTGQQLARLAIGKLAKEETIKAVVQVPLAVFLPDGIAIAQGDKLNFPGRYVRCTQAACLAEFNLQQGDVDDLATGQAAQLKFTSANGQQLSLTVSFKGFDGAFKAAVSEQVN